MRSGIYSIMHIATGRFYVGSARNIRQRLSAHRSMLRAGKHHSPHLQRAWIVYGADAFRISTLELVEPDLLLEREQFWIDRLRASDPDCGFNTAAVAGTRVGVPQSPEARKKMSLAGKGRPKSAEHRAKIGEGNKGKIRTQEYKNNLAVIAKKMSTTPERMAASVIGGKMTGGWNKGISPSEEVRAKMSASAKKRWRKRNSSGHFV